MKKAVVLAIKLLLICAVAAAALAFVNGQTAPVIQARLDAETKESYGVVYEDAEDFKIVEDEGLLNENIIGIVEAYKGGALDGYVFNVSTPSGYDGPVNFVVGVKMDGTVTGFRVLAQTETKGFGAAVADDAYAERMNGTIINGEVTAADGNGAEGQIPAISGATKTTNAMIGGFNAVHAKFEEMKALGPVASLNPVRGGLYEY